MILGLFEKEKISNEINYKSLYKRLTEQVNTINTVSQSIIGITDLDILLRNILISLKKSWKLKFPSIYLIDDNKLKIKSFDVPPTAITMVERALGNNILDSFQLDLNLHSNNVLVKTVKTKSIIQTENFYEFVDPIINTKVARILQSIMSLKRMLTIPLIVNKDVIGVMAVSSPHESFTEVDITGISSVANQIAIAIYNSRLFEENQQQIEALQAKNRDLESLYHLVSSIGETLDPREVAQRAVNAVPQDNDMIGAILSEYDKQKNTLKVKTLTQNALSEAVKRLIGDFGQYVIDFNDPKYINSPYLKILHDGEIVHSDDLAYFISPPVPKQFIGPIKKLLNIKSIVVFPMEVKGESIGTLTFLLKQQNWNELEESKKQLLETYTLQISIALENAQLYMQSQENEKTIANALEKLKELRRQERDMIDVMGHELRTPITIVRNALLVMDSIQKTTGDIPTDTREKYLEMAIESTRREISLIETLLAATKVDAKKIEMSREKVDMLDVINDSIEAQKYAAKEKNLEIIYEEPKNQIFALADRIRVQEVMDNLLSNAVKYTEHGSVNITIEERKDIIYVSVTDTGIGISKEDIGNLGKKFFRAKQYIDGDDPGNQKVVRPGGTGLGLYVVFGLIKGMGGKIIIESELGKGSTFAFTVPKYTGQKEVKYSEAKANPKLDKGLVTSGKMEKELRK